MPKEGFVTVPLHKIFDFSIGTNSGLTKTFVNNNKGPIPVYGASKEIGEASYGYIQDNLPKIKYFENCLTYNKDGASGLLFYREGRFCLSEKVVPLILFPELEASLDYNYLKYAVESVSVQTEYTYSNKATKIKFKDLSVMIPINEDGTYNLDRQKDLADKYRQVEEQKLILSKRLNELENLIIQLPRDSDASWSYVCISHLFKPTNGNSKYTALWCSHHPGSIPLYSGNTFGKYSSIDEEMYDGEYLTWAKDGLAGYVMYHNEKFSITGHRGILIPTDNCVNVDLEYIKYILEPIFRKYKKGREGEQGKNEYTTLNPVMINMIEDQIPIPLRSDGQYDLEKQHEIANRYKQVEEIKAQLIRKVSSLLNLKII